jgi:hypothetical protein
MSEEERNKFWNAHVQSWNKSDLSQADYCRQNNLNKNRFNNWKKKFLNPETNNHFIKIPKKALIPTAPDSIDLIINDCVKIKLTPNFNTVLLKSVLKALGVKNDY